MSSKCGSADVLEALGVRLDLSPLEVAECLETVGVAFMFAPNFHPAMKHAGPPRREIGIRTVFNLLGPLCNPAGASAQVIGVPSKDLVLKIGAALRALGACHALIVHGGGLDELTVTGPTLACELIGDGLHCYTINPEDYGLPRYTIEDIKGGDARWNAAAMLRLLQGESGALRDAVVLNAAAALLVADRVKSLGDGVGLAAEAIDSGRALVKLEKFVETTQMLEMRRAA
jgi:anthranilate phosphoribosyltransferase